MAETPYLGDAEFTVAVDGQQIGGAQTTTAVESQGQPQDFYVQGDFGPGDHTVTVTFLNDKIGDFYPGTDLAIDTTDRNLFVVGATLNGGPQASGAPWELDSGGPHDLHVTAGDQPQQPPSGGSSSGSSGSAGSSGSSDSSGVSPVSGSTGSDTSNTDASVSQSSSVGPDKLSVVLSADLYNGSPNFIAKVDGQTVTASPMSVTAEHGSDSQAFEFSGDWGAGPHDVEIDFLNDAYDGTADTDRNLYVEQVSYNGHDNLDHAIAMFSAGDTHIQAS